MLIVQMLTIQIMLITVISVAAVVKQLSEIQTLELQGQKYLEHTNYGGEKSPVHHGRALSSLVSALT